MNGDDPTFIYKDEKKAERFKAAKSRIALPYRF